MRLCRCDMCEAVAELPPLPTPYATPQQAPRGWAYVMIARERTVQGPAPQRMRLTIETPDGHVAEMNATNETEEPHAGYAVHVTTEVQLCGKCLERLVTAHPALSKRIAQDDMRAEHMGAPVAVAMPR